MAEAFFKEYAPDDYEAESAGTRHKSNINHVASEAMKEVGIDISNQKPKDLTKYMIRNATKIINIGCMDKNFCPILFVHNVIDWEIEDPKRKSIEKVKEIRDEIIDEIIDGGRDRSINFHVFILSVIKNILK